MILFKNQAQFQENPQNIFREVGFGTKMPHLPHFEDSKDFLAKMGSFIFMCSFHLMLCKGRKKKCYKEVNMIHTHPFYLLNFNQQQ